MVFGYSAETSRWLFATIGLASCVGRITLGKISDEVEERWGKEIFTLVIIATNFMNGLCR